MALSGDEDPVGALSAEGADPAFGEGVHPRGLRCGEHDLDANGGEDRVEGGTGLRVAVANQVSESVPGVLQITGETAGHLSHPQPGGVGGAGGAGGIGNSGTVNGDAGADNITATGGKGGNGGAGGNGGTGCAGPGGARGLGGALGAGGVGNSGGINGGTGVNVINIVLGANGIVGANGVAGVNNGGVCSC
ncbi:hypothetical protein AOZ06_40065 [Kibdelosporangium phytohabitans]|uniref:Uncharacterized protein n=1 Tax=Kibdelosporangium phytohabitans TaxID=860235 RepID=A0A0N7F4S4_9PSEU|nr:hypothetical protein AOZ06_40065 [Kibdelosporangium phytohabitans]